MSLRESLGTPGSNELNLATGAARLHTGEELLLGFDFVPAFWDWLLEANENGQVASVEKVADELRDGGDDLADWVTERDDAFFLAPDAAVVASLQVGSTWVTTRGSYDPAAIATFLQESADYYLVGHAHAHQHVVVTHEVSSNSRKRVKIPDACAAMDVECTSAFEMLRASGVRFVKA